MMKTEWMGKYRELISTLYRAANAYSSVCKLDYLGDKVHFSPYEVQILEHVMEHGSEGRNMKWYAGQLGLSQANFSKYVKELVNKGLLERSYIDGNRKNVILGVSATGIEEYEKYAQLIKQKRFDAWFEYLDSLSEEEIARMTEAIQRWSLHSDVSSGKTAI